MKIREYIETILDASSNVLNGKEIPRETERDRVLWGDPDQECTGIASVIYASVEIIEKAHALGVNFIVAHEALFWNHGDHTEWLENNTAFQKKRELLDRYGICVYRYHDHIHAGIKIGDTYKDGIFYGLTTLMGWNDNILNKEDVMPKELRIPKMSAYELAQKIISVFDLKGVRLIGHKDTQVERISLPMHINGRLSDNDLISRINDENIQCLLTLELVDFTVNEYIHDAVMLHEDKCILALGHFNFEEIGMKYYAEYLKENLHVDVPVYFIGMHDYFDYIEKGE